MERLAGAGEASAGQLAELARAAHGVGRGIALVLGEAGATVYASDRETRDRRYSELPGSVEDTAEQVTERGGRGIAVAVDHADDDAVAALFARVGDAHGGLDLLVANAANGKRAAVHRRSVLDVAAGPLAQHGRRRRAQSPRGGLVRRPLLIERRGLAVLTGYTDPDSEVIGGHLFYDLAMHAVSRLAHSLAHNLRPHQVTALAISPGFTRTEAIVAALGDQLPPGTESIEFPGRAVRALLEEPRRRPPRRPHPSRGRAGRRVRLPRPGRVSSAPQRTSVSGKVMASEPRAGEPDEASGPGGREAQAAARSVDGPVTKLTFDITMSLDGFIAGPNPRTEAPLGDGGERLHEWIFGLAAWRKGQGMTGGEANRDSELVEEMQTGAGAVIMGRGMFGGGDGPWDESWEGYWGKEPPYGVPVFVLTHHAREPLVMKGGTTFTFVTDGIESALEQARTAAGDKNVAVAGGANVAQQYLKSGLLDEFQVHLSPLLLGDGVRLFEHLGTDLSDLEVTRVVESATVTHLRYRIVR